MARSASARRRSPSRSTGCRRQQRAVASSVVCSTGVTRSPSRARADSTSAAPGSPLSTSAVPPSRTSSSHVVTSSERVRGRQGGERLLGQRGRGRVVGGPGEERTEHQRRRPPLRPLHDPGEVRLDDRRRPGSHKGRGLRGAERQALPRSTKDPARSRGRGRPGTSSSRRLSSTTRAACGAWPRSRPRSRRVRRVSLGARPPGRPRPGPPTARACAAARARGRRRWRRCRDAGVEHGLEEPVVPVRGSRQRQSRPRHQSASSVVSRRRTGRRPGSAACGPGRVRREPAAGHQGVVRARSVPGPRPVPRRDRWAPARSARGWHCSPSPGRAHHPSVASVWVPDRSVRNVGIARSDSGTQIALWVRFCRGVPPPAVVTRCG